MIILYALSYYIEMVEVINLSQFGVDISYFLPMTALVKTNLIHNRIIIHESITKLFNHCKSGFSWKSN